MYIDDDILNIVTYFCILIVFIFVPQEAEGTQRKPSEEIVPPPADWGGKPTFLQIMKEKAAAAADGAK